MIGYSTTSQTNVNVSVDRTFTADFALSPAVIAGEEIVAVAERDVIAMDMSASQVSIDAEDVKEVPSATSLQSIVDMQMGIVYEPSERSYDERAEIQIRGGGRGQNSLMVDGLTMVDNRGGRPLMMVNLSSVKEVNIIKGGFNAEYGNVRSGLINIVTQDGDPNQYNGSFEFRGAPGHLKHFGESIYDPNNYFLRPYLDPDVAFVGTANGTWDEEMQTRYPSFQGWNQFVEGRTDGLTPEQAQQIFIWQHQVDMDGSLRKGAYDDKPDINVEASLGGPVPFVGKSLGNMTFFASHRTDKQAFALPTNRDYYQEQNTSLKLTSRLTSALKVSAEGIYSKINTVQSAPRASGLDAYMVSGMDILYSPIATGNDYVLGQNAALYYPAALNRFDIFRSMGGISVDHVLSQNTFYNFRFSWTRVENSCIGPDSSDTSSNRFRDATILEMFGPVGVDETPLGYQTGIEALFADAMSSTGEGSVRDYSKVNTINARFDLTSQINKWNQVKMGFEFNYDNLDVHYEHNQIGDAGNNWVIKWNRDPYRASAYIQDKLEFEGMIANFGARADMSFPNANAYTVDRYSQYFRKKFLDDFEDLVPSEPAKNHFKLSPRLGISHPIADVAKLYFNYGHFYSIPTYDEMFLIMRRAQGLSDVGNPSLDLPRTVAYELGVEYSISDMYLLHISGYYKDITDQLANRNWVGYDGGVNYWSRTNDNYQDIRGIEFRLEKRFGSWITGWANYNYLVETSGYVGRQTYYEDPLRQAQEGLQDPNLQRPLARPLANVNLTVSSPKDFGPEVAGTKPFGSIRTDLLYRWRAGKYETIDAYRNWNAIGDVLELPDLQWKARQNFDLRVRKQVTYQRYTMNFYLDIANIFNIKYLEESGFADANDRNSYMRSLRLSRYNGDEAATKEEYEAMGFIAGDDKPGDVKSADKPWIDMPNRGFLTYLNPRTITMGFGLNF